MKRFLFVPTVQAGLCAALCATSLLVTAGCDPKPADSTASVAPSAAASSSAPVVDASPTTGEASPSPSGNGSAGGKMVGPPTPPPGPSAKGSGKIVTTASGLKYEDIKIGTGAVPQLGQTVLVHYTGTLQNGIKFDSSRDRGEPFPFALGQGAVIKGWDEGIASMKVGGQRKLIIPPDLGYGASGAGSAIPPNATLLFDVELVGVQ